MKKAQKEKGLNWINAKENANVYLHFGTPENEFKEFIKRYTQEQQETLLRDYQAQRNRNIIYLSPELKEYSQRIVKILQSRPNNNIKLYFPLFDLVDYKQNNDVAISYVKCLFDWTFANGGDKKEYLRGTKDAFIVSELFKESELILVDDTTGEIITKSTEVIENEIIKVKTETKVITQEKKVGIDKKALDKAKAKVLHEYSKKWNPEIVENILNDLISNFISL